MLSRKNSEFHFEILPTPLSSQKISPRLICRISESPCLSGTKVNFIPRAKFFFFNLPRGESQWSKMFTAGPPKLRVALPRAMRSACSVVPGIAATRLNGVPTSCLPPINRVIFVSPPISGSRHSRRSWPAFLMKKRLRLKISQIAFSDIEFVFARELSNARRGFAKF